MITYPLAYFLTYYFLYKKFSLSRSWIGFLLYGVLYMVVFHRGLNLEFSAIEGTLFLILGFQGAIAVVDLYPEEDFDYGREDALDRSYFLVAFILLVIVLLQWPYYLGIGLIGLTLINGFVRNQEKLFIFRGGLILTLLLHGVITFQNSF